MEGQGDHIFRRRLHRENAMRLETRLIRLGLSHLLPKGEELRAELERRLQREETKPHPSAEELVERAHLLLAYRELCDRGKPLERQAARGTAL